MSKSLRDIRSKQFAKGQHVAVATRDGNVAILRTAIVEDVHEDEGKVTLRWTDRAYYRFGADMSKIFVRGEHIDRPRIVVLG